MDVATSIAAIAALLLGTGDGTRRAGETWEMCRTCMHDRSVAIANIGGVSCDGYCAGTGAAAKLQIKRSTPDPSARHARPKANAVSSNSGIA
ncbi:hypothetical protein XPR_0304 [Xanthomonas arboricola pv. pruni MAFF 301420]|uniref:Uncharacterized protein n=2 Tax=Xanthomonas arboricola pv. pruni TaxID=69929 RepID=W4SCM4_9XANT|nr:hypothetical protein XPU_1996 [Xanthomonas arboricola pv. pruni str. MAFF 311562]GAE53669.1 hypothetical protein XPR_0304 [Xanthomonas arboricola pv. pruni MAFF 301420]GAE62596.1 hypothetical protein XPN_4502 [Xanthomonas arboricola pv. pruni MAFF 301427]